MVEFSQGQAVVMAPGGTFTWAVEGIRPMNPIDLISDTWSVNPVAGSVVGDKSSKSSRTQMGSIRLEVY